MHKYLILFFSVSLFFAGCKADGPPPGVMDPEKMVNMLADIHTVDGQLYAIPQQQDSIYKYGINKYKAVFKKYHTNDATFKKSLKYYSTQPEQIQAMYDTVQKRIAFKTDSLNKIGTQKLKNAVPVQ